MTIATQASLWPTRTEDQAVLVVRTEYSDVFRYDLTEDGVLTISLDERLLDELDQVPEFVEALRERAASISLNQHNIAVLRRLLNEFEYK